MKLRVWWIPQVPMKPFFVLVPNLTSAKMILNALARYDEFQLQHNIKGDYCNAGGVNYYNEEDKDWIDVHADDIPGLVAAIEALHPNFTDFNNFIDRLSLEEIETLEQTINGEE